MMNKLGLKDVSAKESSFRVFEYSGMFEVNNVFKHSLAVIIIQFSIEIEFFLNN